LVKHGLAHVIAFIYFYEVLNEVMHAHIQLKTYLLL